jgi:hypothetical protein
MKKDHVQRVIENANLITFEEMFKGAEDKHVTFDLADPDVVHEQLDSTEQHPHPIYSTEPAYTKTASFFDVIELESDTPKVPRSVTWRREYYATKAAADHLEKSASTLDSQAHAETQKFIHMCKQAAMSCGLRPVLQLAGYASTDESIFDKVASTTVKAVGGVVKQGSYSDVLPNREHPVYKQYARVERMIKDATAHKSGLINAVRMHESVKSEEFLNGH